MRKKRQSHTGDQIQVIEIAKARSHHAVQFDNVFVFAKQSQQHNLAQRALGDSLVLENVLNLFYGDEFARAVIVRRAALEGTRSSMRVVAKQREEDQMISKYSIQESQARHSSARAKNGNA
jgi:hypothetical protein